MPWNSINLIETFYDIFDLASAMSRYNRAVNPYSITLYNRQYLHGNEVFCCVTLILWWFEKEVAVCIVKYVTALSLHLYNEWLPNFVERKMRGDFPLFFGEEKKKGLPPIANYGNWFNSRDKYQQCLVILSIL